MVVAGTLSVEGIVEERVSFHYDMTADVLYLRLVDRAESPAIGEDTPDDLVLFRDEDTDQVVGLDVISWWKRFGEGALPDSLRDVESGVDRMARRLMVEAGMAQPGED